MNGKKYTIIFICSFIAAGLVCVIAGLVTYLVSIYSASASGITSLVGVIILAVGSAETFVSAVILVFYLFFLRKK